MEPDLKDATGELEKLGAAGAAKWPRWVRRNVTPAAAYSIGAVIVTAVVSITVDRVQTVNTRHEYEQQMITSLDTNDQLRDIRIRLARIDGDLVSDRRDLDVLANWHAAVTDTAEIKNPYVQRRRK